MNTTDSLLNTTIADVFNATTRQSILNVEDRDSKSLVFLI